MLELPESTQPRLNNDLKSFSCLTCRQRKVRCDRRNPCTNCTRAGRQCSFVPPVRAKPRRKRLPKEGLHAKLKRYEDLLRSYGADIEPADNDTTSDGGTMSDAEMTEDIETIDTPPADSFMLNESKTKLVSKNGSTRYFDNGPWSNLRNQFHHPEEEELRESVTHLRFQEPAGLDLSADCFNEHEMVLSSGSQSKNLTSLHQPLHMLRKMMDVYIDKVDPLIKLLHVPTFWTSLTNAHQNPQDIPKSVEAVIFAFYLATITSLDDDECFSLLGEEKDIISARYQAATRQALINANFLKTSSLAVLQAYMLYLMSMRVNYQNETLFILSGIAVRLARRMGLHRDGTFLGLSPLETEERRRVWWHVVHTDWRTADYSGTKPTMDLFLSDTKTPLNVEDEDLTSDMIDPPPERTGITSIVLCLIRCDVMELVYKFTPQFSNDIRWENLSTSTITLAEKDKMISQVEDTLERKYVRYADPSNALHYFASVMARYSICKIKLYAHSPRQFASSGIKVPQKSRDNIFSNGLKLLEYGNLMHNNPVVHKFMWQIGTGYLWDTLLYVLIEARHRKRGPEVDRAWKLIGVVFENYPQILERNAEALYVAIGNWTLQVWDDCLAGRRAEGISDPDTPDFITAIRRCRRPLIMESPSEQKPLIDPGSAKENLTDYVEVQSLGYDENFTNTYSNDSYDFSNLLSYDLEPNEWLQWERLFARQAMES